MQNTTPQDQPQQPKRYQCRHIFTDGHRCGSAALRNEDFCYYHHTTRRPAANPRARRARRAAFDLPLPENRSAIQSAIGQVLQRIAANDLDPRRAGLLLYGLQIAALNLPKQQPIEEGQDKPHEAIVEQIEIHPELGPLAPQAEAPHPYRLARQHILEYKIREADEMREKLFKKERELKDKEDEFGRMQGRVIVLEAELRKLKSAAPPTPRPAYPQPAVLPEIKAVAAPPLVSKPGADGSAGAPFMRPHRMIGPSREARSLSTQKVKDVWRQPAHAGMRCAVGAWREYLPSKHDPAFGDCGAHAAQHSRTVEWGVP